MLEAGNRIELLVERLIEPGVARYPPATAAEAAWLFTD